MSRKSSNKGNPFDQALNVDGKNKQDFVRIYKSKGRSTSHNVRHRAKDLTPELLDKFVEKNHFNEPTITNASNKQRWLQMQQAEAQQGRERFIESISNSVYKKGQKKSTSHDMEYEECYNVIEAIRQGRVDMADVGQSANRPGYTYQSQNVHTLGDCLPPKWAEALRQGWVLAQMSNPQVRDNMLPYAPTGLNQTFNQNGKRQRDPTDVNTDMQQAPENEHMGVAPPQVDEFAQHQSTFDQITSGLNQLERDMLRFQAEGDRNATQEAVRKGIALEEQLKELQRKYQSEMYNESVRYNSGETDDETAYRKARKIWKIYNGDTRHEPELEKKDEDGDDGRAQIQADASQQQSNRRPANKKPMLAGAQGLQ